MRSVPAVAVTAVETLGAGDVEHGAFTLKLAEGESEEAAIRYANAPRRSNVPAVEAAPAIRGGRTRTHSCRTGLRRLRTGCG
ncbi:PfkB family carbohydrate kinase, partial [Mesorhizobium sp. J428]|uniref:PfkB family carbohydrate kinase n=1 Tax=Mesorhizobium sp. J428 TaxID=2898440 RepID=UPI002151F1E7